MMGGGNVAWTIVESRALNTQEMTGNAQEIVNIWSTQGWTRNPLCAILGNMVRESSINSGRWQGDNVGNWSGGFGLVQWTPATNYTNWATANGYERTDPAGQLYWINNLSQTSGQWIITSEYPISWNDFKNSTRDIEWLTRAFEANFERAGVPAMEERIKWANYWNEHLDFSGSG